MDYPCLGLGRAPLGLGCLALLLLAPALAQPPAPSPSPLPCSAIPASAPWADCVLATQPGYGPLGATGVAFTTADATAQALFAHAEAKEAANAVPDFAPGFAVLVEGCGYGNVWLETQPMGGASYGVRNLTLALNNQLVFVRTQRADGRLAGMVTRGANGVVHPTFSYPGNANHSMLQGFYMASPAVDVALLMAASGSASAAVAAYLVELQGALARFEGWLWAARNSSSGVLWLADTADTGEDGSDKYRPLPSNPIVGPFESMDMMGYAHDAQRALARIAALQGDAAESGRWAARAAATAAALRARLWRQELGACFDRERDGAQRYVSSLLHNNLRAMWAGAFDQGMADAFVAQHLMNRSEFWTATPLPSIAASDARFQNVPGNNWGGPAEGLTFQRAIRALGSYGHHAEVLLLGAAQAAALAPEGRFPQQINPLTSVPDRGDGYGPQMLALLEYTALRSGVALRGEPPALLFSGLGSAAFVYEQRLGSSVWRAEGWGNGTFAGSRDGQRLFVCTGRARVVVDLGGGGGGGGGGGAVTGVVGASAATEAVALLLPGSAAPLQLQLEPNTEWTVDGDAPPVLARRVPFTPPY
jgi:hypothetical protein